MDPLAQLEALMACRAPVEDRPNLASLLRVTLADGTRWIAATNGHVALGFPSHPILEAAASDPAETLKIGNLIDVLHEAEGSIVEMQALKDWATALPGEIPLHLKAGEVRPQHCGTCDAARHIACEDCDGCGERELGDDPAAECFECDGTGRLPCPRCHPATLSANGGWRRGWLGGVMLNRTSLYRAVRSLPPGPCRVLLGEPYQPIRIQGDGWRAAVMPMRQTCEDEAEEREAPVFEPLRTPESAHGWRRAS